MPINVFASGANRIATPYVFASGANRFVKEVWVFAGGANRRVGGAYSVTVGSLSTQRGYDSGFSGSAAFGSISSTAFNGGTIHRLIFGTINFRTGLHIAVLSSQHPNMVGAVINGVTYLVADGFLATGAAGQYHYSWNSSNNWTVGATYSVILF